MSIQFELITLLAILSVGQGMRNASDEEFPFHVSIRSLQENAHVCGGVLIMSKWVLTVRECTEHFSSVLVKFDGPDIKIPSKRIHMENVRTHKLALIELEREMEFSDSAKQCKLPVKSIKFLSNSTKLSGWKIGLLGTEFPVLSAIDKFLVVTDVCRKPNGDPVNLEPDEFCGIDQEFPFHYSLVDLGTAVSKDGIVIGLLAGRKTVPPAVFTDVAKYEGWIRAILKEDADKVSWMTEVPKDSAVPESATSFAFVTAAAAFAVVSGSY